MLAAVVLMAAGGCAREKLKVVDRNGGDDFGRAAVLEAVEVAGRELKSPKSFRRLAEAIDKESPRFNEEVGNLAERKLVFLAIHPIAAAAHLPPEELISVLGTTVWPTALRVDPAPDESPRKYLYRACETDLASVCGRVVPEYWGTLLHAEVLDRLRDRAREAYVLCKGCQGEATHRQAMRMYDEELVRARRKVTALRDELKPKSWPEARPHAQAGAASLPILQFRPNGEAAFRGSVVEGDDDWGREIAAHRDDADVLGVHLRPAARVSLLTAIVKEARRAGYREVALQTRGRKFPFEPRYYLIKTSGRGERVRIRPTDTIQVLVQTLDNAVAAQAERGERGAILLEGA